MAKYSLHTSMPINLRLSILAATPVLPAPTNGSSTKSSSCVESAMQRAGNAMGN